MWGESVSKLTDDQIRELLELEEAVNSDNVSRAFDLIFAENCRRRIRPLLEELVVLRELAGAIASNIKDEALMPQTAVDAFIMWENL